MSDPLGVSHGQMAGGSEAPVGRKDIRVVVDIHLGGGVCNGREAVVMGGGRGGKLVSIYGMMCGRVDDGTSLAGTEEREGGRRGWRKSCGLREHHPSGQ